jgi:hypothetical protein
MNEMAATKGWEMGGYHTLWWTFRNGEVEHYAVLHQEENGLERSGSSETRISRQTEQIKEQSMKPLRHDGRVIVTTHLQAQICHLRSCCNVFPIGPPA